MRDWVRQHHVLATVLAVVTLPLWIGPAVIWLIVMLVHELVSQV